MQSQQELVALAKSVAGQHELYPELVCGVVERESTWNPWAMRYEAAFYQRYVAAQLARGSLVGGDTEAQARTFSWGLMQMMGQAARERGFTGMFLSELCDPAVGLEYGCRHLAEKLALAGGNVRQALLLWNGGANTAYPDSVMALSVKYK